jgi:hypothetical protein
MPQLEYALFTVSWFGYRLYHQVQSGRLKGCATSVASHSYHTDGRLETAVQTREKKMSPALIWIDIIIVSAIIMAYLATLPGTPGIPSSSYYLNGKGPKP